MVACWSVLFKSACGICLWFFYLQPAYVANSDTWHYFDLSKAETDWLLRDPVAFFTDLFNHGYNTAGNLLKAVTLIGTILRAT